jgi:hypothetical protein
VRGKDKQSKVKRKKSYKLRVPIGITLLNPKKIIPIGSGFFNQEKLIYIPSDMHEQQAIEASINGTVPDPMIDQMILGKYVPREDELKKLGTEWEFAPATTNLYVCNPKNVWRHTLTKPQWEMVADVRMTSVFELLDMKVQLKEMDRAHLIGGTNFIILIKKGSDTIPAKPAELSNLRGGVSALARVPMLVSDHRLTVEIVTPKLDLTLNSEKYDLLDSRIAMRMYQMFNTSSGKGTHGEDSIKLGRVIARGLESRRHMLRRNLEKNVLKPTFRENPLLKDEPQLRFYPKQIALAFDSAQATFYMDLRDRREISRDTLLAQIDISEDDEARKMEREAELYDDVFQSEVPFNGGPETKAGGRTQGGNRAGGGAAPGTGQGKPPTSTKTADEGSPRKTQK